MIDSQSHAFSKMVALLAFAQSPFIHDCAFSEFPPGIDFVCTVLLKGKLTVTHVLILETRDLILDSRNFRGSSLASRGSSLEFR